MKARKSTDTKSVKKKPVLVVSEAKDNVCAFFKLLLEIDKRKNPTFYEDQKSRNHFHLTP